MPVPSDAAAPLNPATGQSTGPQSENPRDVVQTGTHNPGGAGDARHTSVHTSTVPVSARDCTHLAVVAFPAPAFDVLGRRGVLWLCVACGTERGIAALTAHPRVLRLCQFEGTPLGDAVGCEGVTRGPLDVCRTCWRGIP